MSAEILDALARSTLAASAAIMIVMLLRRPVRNMFGAQIGYALWLLAPAAVIGSFIPARVALVASPTNPASANADIGASLDHPMVDGIRATDFGAFQTAQNPWAGVESAELLVFVWIGGVVFSMVVLFLRHRRTLRDINVAGPAVIGILRPQIMLPHDFELRYSAAERELVLAHERAHLARGDAQVNAFAALLHCLNWFNPLFAVARKALRIDQELACDARVMSRHGAAKRAYAEAMLKTQLGFHPGPFACRWPPTGRGALKQRIAMLGRPRPTRSRARLGGMACAFSLVAAMSVAWIAQPPQIAYADNEKTPAGSLELGRLLVEVMQEGRMDGARQLIAAGADVNAFIPGDGTPLVIAARRGDRDMVALLIAHEADVNQSAPGDGNPLIMAATFGFLDVAELLVANGADVNGVVRGDETPLINAARENRIEMARYLIGHGADVNLAVDAPTVRGIERRSPLIMARRGGHADMERLLRQHGAAD